MNWKRISIGQWECISKYYDYYIELHDNLFYVSVFNDDVENDDQAFVRRLSECFNHLSEAKNYCHELEAQATKAES